MITIDDFKKLEIRIGTVISVERVPDTDKLLKFQFDLGTEKRQILAGMAEFFPDPEVLVGRQLPVIVNMEPRTIRGEVSHGMIMATDSDSGVVLISPDTVVQNGSIVR